MKQIKIKFWSICLVFKKSLRLILSKHFQHLSSSNIQLTFLGDFPDIQDTAYKSLAGFYFFSALDNIDKILMQTADTFKAGDHSLYRIDRQMKPFE